MALYQSRGRISDMSEVQSGTSKNGYQWQRMTIVLEIPGFQGSVIKQCFQVSGDDVSDVLLYNIGDRVEISWSMYAREWNGRWYNNVDLVKINSLEQQQSEKPAPAPAPKQLEFFDNPPESLDPAEHPDDLPF